MPRLTPEQLEAQIHGLLRDQPPRRAPVSLESRVLAEIARRQALPWWRKSYADWPAPVQIAFLVLSVGVALLAGLVAMQAFSGGTIEAAISVALRPVFEGLTAFRTAGTALLDLVRGWIPAIPTVWVYAALGAAALGYATLVGIGATAYRVLWQHR
jgi:hypothetical protein